MVGLAVSTSIEKAYDLSVSVLLNLEYHLDLDGDTERQLRHADGGPSVFANRFAEDLDHEI